MAESRGFAASVAVFGVAAGALLAVAWGHGLRFVDVLSFSRRAMDLVAGKPASDGLYPLGYPALLAAIHATGVPLVRGAQVVSGLAAAGLVAAVHRRHGLAAALFLVVQPSVLQWGTTEGTDMLAAALSLGAVLGATRPRAAGLALGLALCVRWTAAAWVPAVFWVVAPRDRLRTLGWALVATLPHWLACAWSGAVVLPDQSLNLAIAAGPGAPPAATGLLATAARIPGGLAHVWPHVLGGIAPRFGLAGLVLTAIFVERRDKAREADGSRTAQALLLGALLHTLALAAVFGNPRLALPAALALSMGAGALVARVGRLGGGARAAGGLLLASAAAWTGWTGVPAAREPSGEEGQLRRLAAAMAELPAPPKGQVLANSPLAHTERDGWLVPSVNLGGLYVTPQTTPAELGRLADAHGLDVVVLDSARGRAAYAGLSPLFRGTDAEVDGWTRVSTGGWCVWRRGEATGTGTGVRSP